MGESAKMPEGDEALFRRLTGAKEEPEETPEERQARQERIERGEQTIGDAFKVLPEVLKRTRNYYLGLYGLNNAYTEEEAAQVEASFALMSKEQEKQYRRAWRAYRKRNLRTRDKDDPTNNLASFAATNPPEALRKHVWRLQRGLDEPMFGGGQKPEEKLSRVREYAASLTVSLCDTCAEELKQETEQAGAERSDFRSKNAKDYFYDSESAAGFYLFRYEEMHVERVTSDNWFSFPHGEPKQCARCGVNDVDLWRERFGESAG